jgi:chaperone BCS1
MSELFQTLFHDNPYFTAGFGLLGVGAGMAAARQGITRLVYLARRRYLTTVEVTSKDPAYGWIVNWLTERALASGSHFTVNARHVKANNVTNSTPVRLSPAPGVHYLRWQGVWIKVQREREKGALMDLTTGVPFETITMTTIGRRPQLFIRMLSEAQERIAAQEQGKLVVYTSWAAEWRPFGNPRRKRTLESVIFEEGVKEGIVEDVKEFLTSGQWYLDRGIPYRRGYLLYGPPGGGKSSFIQALASELDYNICLLSLSDTMLTDDRLNHLLNVLPERSILLLEDIDSAMSSPERPHGKLTFSGLLNALDGVASSEERLIFMTTNHYDRLDPALIRPGRVDLQQYIGRASHIQIERMFSRFYPQHGHLSKRFADVVTPLNLSPAAIQGHFIQYKASPLEAVENPPTTPTKAQEKNPKKE